MTIERSAERSAAATTTDRAPSRLDFLDMLRGVAALSVFVSHVGERVWPAFKHMVYTSFDLGNFGVMLFFLCSGFIIPISLEKQGSLWRFWVRRILRLYPLYWFSIALSIVLSYAMAGDVTISDFLAKNSATILANITMLQLVFGFEHIHGEYWTLMFELFFYMIVSILFVLGMIKRTGLMAVALILAAIVVEAVLPLLSGMRFPIGIIGFIATMFTGTIFYRLHSGEISRRMAGVVLGLSIVMLIVTAIGNPAGDDMRPYLNYATARVAAFLVFGAVFLLRSRHWPRFGLYLGTVSYSIYLMQGFVLQVDFGGLVRNLLGWPVLILLVSWLTYRWIEHPAIVLGRRLTRRS
jgi:peptidoglycan/LPS O-acetylase OafA/YrhL